jgi:retron-type reverse transcriptase
VPLTMAVYVFSLCIYTAVDVDLSKFFDRVNHDLLMTQLRNKVQHKRLLALIGKYLRAGVMINDQFEASFEGVPQGGPLSPLLSNIMWIVWIKSWKAEGINSPATRTISSSWLSLTERESVINKLQIFLGIKHQAFWHILSLVTNKRE